MTDRLPYVVDDFLPKDQFKELQNNIVWNDQLTWNLCSRVSSIETPEEESQKDNWLAGHSVFQRGIPVSPLYEPLCEMLLKKISPPGTWKLKGLLRMKINFYGHTEKLFQHKMHYDYPFDHVGALLSLNTCDGGTVLEDGTKYDSVANRMLFFNPAQLHASTTTTNKKGRFNILVNYV